MISSTSNQHIRRLRQLLTKSKERSHSGCFVAEGIRMVSEIPPDMIREIFISESFATLHMGREDFSFDISGAVIVDDDVFRSVSDTRNPQGVMAVVQQFSYYTEDIFRATAPLILILENIQDPGNLGTMIRTAEGAGAAGVVLCGETADIYNPKTVRSTMGSLCRVPFVYVRDIREAAYTAKSYGVTLYAASLEGSSVYTEYDYLGGTAFMIGNEGNGLSDKAASCADRCIRIPMMGRLESLNASVSASILMYEVLRQRQRHV